MKLTPEQIIKYTDGYPPYEGRSFCREMSDWETRIDKNKMRQDRLAKFRQTMKDQSWLLVEALLAWRRLEF